MRRLERIELGVEVVETEAERTAGARAKAALRPELIETQLTARLDVAQDLRIANQARAHTLAVHRLHVHVERRAVDPECALAVDAHRKVGIAEIGRAGAQPAGGVAPYVADIERIDGHGGFLFRRNGVESICRRST